MKKKWMNVPITVEEMERIVALVTERAPIKTDALLALLHGGGCTMAADRVWRAKVQLCRAAGRIAYAKLDREFFLAPLGWVEPMESVIQRIYGRVVRDNETGCLQWQDRLDSGNRALIFSLGKSYMARRVLYNVRLEERGRKPLGRYQTLEPWCACEGHCIEPSHMKVVEHSVVLARIKRPPGYGVTMAKKAREKAKLTEAMVLEMRNMRAQNPALTAKQIQVSYPHVSRSTISMVLRHKTWKDYSFVQGAGQPSPFTGLGGRQC